jgi:asparagine synthase (glutamine-hydrolysing)
MRDVMAYRGPDGSGEYISPGVGLGHVRLSILDLSTNAAQPMADPSGNYQIVFNGEIYNFVEIRRELEQKGFHFRSTGDTEVLLSAYLCWGEECLSRLVGMFAFAIWDESRRGLFFARDRLGIKPFYYSYDGSSFLFASEIKSILLSGMAPIKPNRAAIGEYLQSGFTFGGKTWFEGIQQLPPGKCGAWTPEGLSIREYWDVEFDESQEASEKSEREWAEELGSLLSESVRLHLRSDVPVGAALSGGLDSSGVVALAHENGADNLNTFSARYRDGAGFDEGRWSDLVVKTFGCRHHTEWISHEGFPETVRKLVWHLDEPIIAAPVYAQYRVYQRVAREGIKVVLGGQGGDELFAGYIWHYMAYFEKRYRQWLEKPWDPRRFLAWLEDGVGVLRHFEASFLWNGLIRRLRHPQAVDLALDSFRSQIPPAGAWNWNPKGLRDPLNILLYRDIKNYLPGLLTLDDRTSMAVSVESRVPLCNHRLVEMAARIPANLKLRNCVTKHIEREALRPRLPKEIIDRKDKKGFPIPIDPWFQGPLRSWVEEVLRSPRVKERGIFDPVGLERAMGVHFSGAQPMANRLWSAINVELWHQTFIDRPLSELMSPLT